MHRSWTSPSGSPGLFQQDGPHGSMSNRIDLHPWRVPSLGSVYPYLAVKDKGTLDKWDDGLASSSDAEDQTGIALSRHMSRCFFDISTFSACRDPFARLGTPAHPRYRSLHPFLPRLHPCLALLLPQPTSRTTIAFSISHRAGSA